MRNSLALATNSSLAILADTALTIIGQPEAYKNGEYSYANEFNPIAHSLLIQSPLHFIAGATMWSTLCCVSILSLPTIAAYRVSQLVTFAHLIGASTWMISYSYGVAYIITIWFLQIFIVSPKLQITSKPS